MFSCFFFIYCFNFYTKILATKEAKIISAINKFNGCSGLLTVHNSSDSNNNNNYQNCSSNRYNSISIDSELNIILVKIDEKSSEIMHAEKTIKSLLNREQNIFRNIKTTTSCTAAAAAAFINSTIIPTISSASNVTVNTTHNNNNNNNTSSDQYLRSLLDMNKSLNLINDSSISTTLPSSTGISNVINSSTANLIVSNNDNSNRYNCINCNRIYNNEEKLKRHINNTHKKEKKFECNICSKR